MRFPSVFLFLSPCLFAVAAIGQTIQSPSPNPSSGQTPQADQPTIDTSTANSNPSSTELSPVVVIGQLNEARDQIVPYLGATKYTIPQEQVQNEAQGSNAPFNHVILQAPGVVQDSYGQLHVRDEHANLQYRIDDVCVAGFS
jgi:outer membrane receptor for ferrienterochelin and colicins